MGNYTQMGGDLKTYPLSYF